MILSGVYVYLTNNNLFYVFLDEKQHIIYSGSYKRCFINKQCIFEIKLRSVLSLLLTQFKILKVICICQIVVFGNFSDFLEKFIEGCKDLKIKILKIFLPYFLAYNGTRTKRLPRK